MFLIYILNICFLYLLLFFLINLQNDIVTVQSTMILNVVQNPRSKNQVQMYGKYVKEEINKVLYKKNGSWFLTQINGQTIIVSCACLINAILALAVGVVNGGGNSN